MRKLLMAALVSLALMLPGGGTGGAKAQDSIMFTQGTPAELTAPAAGKWDRFARALDKTGKVIKDFGPHNDNPFPDKDACMAGLEQDTKLLYIWLAQYGVDISNVDVIVECKPVGTEA